MATQTWTLETVRAQLATDNRWTQRALVVLFNRQTASEQETGSTHVLNGRGFNGSDAEILSSFARQVIAGRTLSARQLEIAQRKAPKYARQILEEIQAAAGATPSTPEVSAVEMEVA